MPLFRLNVDRQFDVFPKAYGVYSSFPSLERDPATGEVLLVYRQAQYNPDDTRPGMRQHGLDGTLYARRWQPEGQTWSDAEAIYTADEYPPNLIDGFLTRLGDRLHMVFRRYPSQEPVFYTAGSGLDDLKRNHMPKLFPTQTCFPAPPAVAQWGKIVQLENGDLLQAVYGYPEEAVLAEVEADKVRATRVAAYLSTDNGENWSFLNWITPLVFDYEGQGINANETALFRVANRVYAVMRTQNAYPCPLHVCWSDDHGYTWTLPQPSSKFGEAPAWTTLPTGHIMVGYRGYRPQYEDEGGTIALSFFDPVLNTLVGELAVDAYLGNHYDGGYCDLIWLHESRQLLVAYYYCDTPDLRNPWIRCALVSIYAQ